MELISEMGERNDRRDFFLRASNHDNARILSLSGVAQHDMEVWNLLPCSHQSLIVRVVTIKHPPAAIEGITPDNFAVGRVYDLTPQLGILMIAAGWARSETRKQHRRENDVRPPINRRRENDRRSDLAN